MPRLQGVDLAAGQADPHQPSLSAWDRADARPAPLRPGGIDPQRCAKEMTDDEIARIAAILDREYLIEVCAGPRMRTSSG